MEAKAIAKHVRMFPTKVGVVPDLIRGKSVNKAFAILRYTPRDAAEAISKVSKLAVANAKNSHELNVNRLSVAEAHIDHGPTSRRFRSIGRGKAFRINRRTSNITLVVKEGVQ